MPTRNLTVYHLPFSRSVRVLWLLQELGLPYNIKEVEFKPGQYGGEAYTKIEPLNRVPALVDDDMIMSDSIAIIQYILARYGEGKLAPKLESDEYPAYLQWLQFGESTLAQTLGGLMGQRRFFGEENRSQFMDIWLTKQLKRQLAVLETQLEGRDYILKSGFSAADISVAYPLLLARIAKAHDQITPRIQQYYDLICARPAWQNAMAKTT